MLFFFPSLISHPKKIGPTAASNIQGQTAMRIGAALVACLCLVVVMSANLPAPQQAEARSIRHSRSSSESCRWLVSSRRSNYCVWGGRSLG